MKLKRYYLLAVLLVFLFPASALAGAQETAAQRVDGRLTKGLTFLNYEEAIKKATEENKLVMVFFWADWCRYCTQIRKEVFENDKVREPFEKSFVAVSVDMDNDPEKLAGLIKPKALPTLAFLRPNGEVLGLLPGAVDLKNFIELVEYIGDEALKKPASIK